MDHKHAQQQIHNTRNQKPPKKSKDRGCPQGGILSHILWNLVVNYLLKHDEEYDIGNVQAFEDDSLSLARV